MARERNGHGRRPRGSAFGFELFSLRGTCRLLDSKLLSLGREQSAVGGELLHGGALLVPEFATRRKLFTFALHPLALCDLTFAFDLPLGKLLLPFLFFFDELSPIGLQPIPGVFQRLLLAGEVGLLLLNVRHAPREILILH